MIECFKAQTHLSRILSCYHPIIHSFFSPMNNFQFNNMILVFKTNVSSGHQAKKLKPHLDQSLPNSKWNFDLTDCDKVLRVDSPEDITMLVIQTLNSHGFECAELE